MKVILVGIIEMNGLLKSNEAKKKKLKNLQFRVARSEDLRDTLLNMDFRSKLFKYVFALPKAYT